MTLARLLDLACVFYLWPLVNYDIQGTIDRQVHSNIHKSIHIHTFSCWNKWHFCVFYIFWNILVVDHCAFECVCYIKINGDNIEPRISRLCIAVAITNLSNTPVNIAWPHDLNYDKKLEICWESEKTDALNTIYFLVKIWNGIPYSQPLVSKIHEFLSLLRLI